MVVFVLLFSGIAATPRPAFADSPDLAQAGEPGDNITPEVPPPGDNVNPEAPLSGDNVTPKLSQPAKSNGGALKQAGIDSRDKGNPKLDSPLNRLAQDSLAAGTAPLSAMGAPAPQAIENTVRVIIESAPNRISDVAASAGAFGTIEASYGDLVQAVVPVSRLTALADIPEVGFVRLPDEPVPAQTSEGVSLINADDWLAGSFDGTGVKIGILDGGFGGYTIRQSQGELPASIATWWAPSIGAAGSNVHGTACAEIAYDIAPGAEFYFANFSTVVEYGNAVEWLIAQGEDVISSSVGWPMGGRETAPASPAEQSPASGPNWWLIGAASVGCLLIGASLFYFGWWRKRST